MTPVLRRLADIEPRPVSWLWPSYVPLGKLTILEGHPGMGKTLVLSDLIARITTGRTMPDGSASDLPGPANVLLLAAEDDASDTLRPRFAAVGADLNRVYLWETITTDEVSRLPALPEDTGTLASIVTEADVKLVVVDPVMAFLSPRIDAWRDAEVRRVLTPLAALAADLGIAVVAIRHWTKSPTLNPLHRGSGSIAFSAAARSVLVVGQHPEDDDLRVLVSLKSNLGPKPPALGFVIEQAGTAPVVRWRGPVDLATTDLTSAGRDPSPERSAVLAYVKGAGRPVGSKEVAEALGMTTSTARWHLHQAAKAGQLVRTATGLYGCPTTSNPNGSNNTNNTNNANNLESVHINGVGDVGDVGGVGAVGDDGCRYHRCYSCGGPLQEPEDWPGWLRCEACGLWSRTDDPAYTRRT
jgi:hypothetical protein